MIVVNYGGGVNSTALLVEAHNRSIRPDVIVFADTGSEMPHTYKYLDEVNAWLAAHDMPPLSVTRWERQRPSQLGERAVEKGEFVPLHEWCESTKSLPSKAYGLSGCTSKWKQQPADRFIKTHPLVVAAHAAGELVERWIGFDAGEPERSERMLTKNPDGHLWRWRAPLVEWDMDRDACVSSIQRAGLSNPGKSSCWMCPSMKKHEIVSLGERYPALLERALVMEDNADLVSIKGLGRSFKWRGYLAERAAKADAENATACEVVDTDCGCYDGSDDLGPEKP